MLKAFKYRIKPSKAVEENLQRTLDICRELYNAALQERRDAYKQCGVSVNYQAQATQFPEIKVVRPDVAIVHSQVLQDVLKRLQRAFENFFRRVKAGEQPGYPRFKGTDRYDSFTYPQGGWKLDGDKLWLSQIGSLRLSLSRPTEGTVKTVTLKREAGKWSVIFTCEVKSELISAVNCPIGVDVNLENFLTTSDGEVVDNPRWYRKAEKFLGWCQRWLSRKKKGSKRRRKAILRLQQAHAKVKNQRRDFQHKLSRTLVNENDAIFFETLQIKNMVKNHCLAKSLSDVAWGTFLSMVAYKAEEAGKLAIGINPQWTTQECSRCGSLVLKGLSQRWHSCPVCWLQLPRDYNSALNILRRGIELVSADGQSVAAQGGLGLPEPENCEPVLGCEMVHIVSLPSHS